MKFEILHRPTTNPELPEWCQRLQDSHGQRMYISDGPACPTDWAAGSWDGNPRPDGPQDNRGRQIMLQTMLTELRFGRAPQGREEAWNRLTIIAEDLAEGRTIDLVERRLQKRRARNAAKATGNAQKSQAFDPDGAMADGQAAPPPKKVSKFCDLLRRVNGAFHPG